MNHGSDVTAASSHSSEFEEDRRLKPEVNFLEKIFFSNIHEKQLGKFLVKMYILL